MDYLAIVSSGAFPTPTPTASERALYAASYGLLPTTRILTVVRKIVGIFGLGKLGIRC